MRKRIGKAMVVGAGISGIRSALDLAEYGYRVTLVDKAPHIGGILSQLDYQFPNDRCGMCRMLPLVDRDASSQYCLRKGLFHENIDILLGTRLTALDGEPGNFRALLEQKPAYVDPDRCIGCGECARVCPVEVKDDFNLGLGMRKAAYLPVPHNIPNTYVIDYANCTRCGECVEICPTRAIEFPEERRKNFHILVVDDELIVRDSLKEWLTDEGFSVDMADSGQAALAMLADKTYHLMLTDIKMPGMDGVALLGQAAKDHPELTIVMMTAYATVETAVEAMKQGAMDYLLKPFNPETFTPKILEIYQALDVVQEKEIEVNAVVFSAGTDYFDPMTSKNTFGYGMFKDVVTSREFERLISGTGPDHGQLVRQSDRGAVKRIAWFQCVGSRNQQVNADFCSSVCCMHAVKEARLVKEKYGPDVETTIFYMDMRSFNKSFHQYVEQARTEYGIRFERSRVHTVTENTEGGLLVRYTGQTGETREVPFDLIVLSIGQRPSKGTQDLARIAGIPVNQWGFCTPEPFSTSLTPADGIFLGGSFTGLKDISESVIQSNAAALSASRFIHAKGGSMAVEPDDRAAGRDISRERPQILVMACTCGSSGRNALDKEQFKEDFLTDPAVADVIFLDQVCTRQGWDELTAAALDSGANRFLIGACLPYAYTGKIKELAKATGIPAALIHITDIRPAQEKNGIDAALTDALKTGVSRLRRSDPPELVTEPAVQKALVVGAGVSGMAAALAVADHGYEVDLIEEKETPGGNLNWLSRTIEGHDVKEMRDRMLETVGKHPLIRLHTRSCVTSSFGFPGHFITTIENKETSDHKTFEHGAAILATGGTEAATESYGHGTSPAVVTHRELDQGLAGGDIKAEDLGSVVMIQCVDSREKDKKNYCSRICCSSSLKYALALKEENPEITIYILYRDLMAYGFLETYYTRAREAGIIFIQYEPDRKPQVEISGDRNVTVMAYEPILNRDIEIRADLLVLATGISPGLPEGLAAHFGIAADDNGFFMEADAKWRPVDALKEGVFACGLSHSPRNITEAVASAEACAQRALRLLGDTRLVSAAQVARVHHSLCSLCERCIAACPYGARTLSDGKVEVNPVMCQGCGSCAEVCPNSASVLAGFKDQQVFDIIDSVF